LVPPKLVEFTFPVDIEIRTNIATNIVSDNEVNAIDDFPEDEVTNGPYYGISRIKKVELISKVGQTKRLLQNTINTFKPLFLDKTSSVVADRVSCIYAFSD
jgi:hypothetical protein